MNTAKKNYDFKFYDINNDSEELKSQKWDVIILSHILEHVHKRSEMLQKLNSLMTDNGSLIIAIPQERIRGDCTIIQLLYNELRFRFENPHLVKINYQELDDMVKQSGMKIGNHMYSNLFPPFLSDNKRIYSWSLITECKKK